MKIVITGTNGQVGQELVQCLQNGAEIIGLDRKAMDLSDGKQIRDVIRAIKPDLIINPAAYTAVDKAESEPDLAKRINADAPAILAEEAKHLGATLIHYSTDYVFDGTKSSPYVETDATNPLNVYGKTKLEGEQGIVASGVNHLILRTSWVYGMRGKNFLLTILRLAQERDELRIVDDQYGAPTCAHTIACATADVIAQSLKAESAAEWWQERAGIYHMTAQGKTTWFRFAQAILELSRSSRKPLMTKIMAAEFPTPAHRPTNSALSCDKFIQAFGPLPQWSNALEDCMAHSPGFVA